MNMLVLQLRRGLLMLCFSLMCSAAAYAAAITYPLNFNMGWNLLGNTRSLDAESWRQIFKEGEVQQ